MIAKLTIASFLLACATTLALAAPTKGLREDSGKTDLVAAPLVLEQKQAELEPSKQERVELPPIKQAEQKREEVEQARDEDERGQIRDESSWQQQKEEVKRPLTNSWQQEAKTIKATEEKRDESHLKTRVTATAHAPPQLTKEFNQLPLFSPEFNVPRRSRIGESLHYRVGPYRPVYYQPTSVHYQPARGYPLAHPAPFVRQPTNMLHFAPRYY